MSARDDIPATLAGLIEAIDGPDPSGAIDRTMARPGSPFCRFSSDATGWQGVVTRRFGEVAGYGTTRAEAAESWLREARRALAERGDIADDIARPPAPPAGAEADQRGFDL